MKALLSFFIILSASYSFASSINLISSKQFQKLTRQQQVKYLKGLQKIMLAMGKKSPYIAGTVQDLSRMPASSAFSDDDYRLYSLSIEEIPDSEVKATLATPPEVPAPRVPTPPVAEVKKVTVDTIPVSRIEPITKPPTSSTPPAAKKTSKVPVDESLLPGEELVSEEELQAMLKKSKEQKASQLRSSTQQVRSAQPAPLKTQSQLPATSPMPNVPTTKSSIEDSESKDTSNSRAHYRCMYAGWVIENDPCSPPQKIPDWMEYEGMSESHKSCEGWYAICNPVIFGLKLPNDCKNFSSCPDQAKPMCAPRGKNITEECYRMAETGNSKGTQVAAELNSLKPEYYERYKEMFKDLCDEEQIKTNPYADIIAGVRRSEASSKRMRRDLSMTCDWASKQIDELNSLIELKALVKPEPKGSDSSGTSQKTTPQNGSNQK